MDEFYKFTIAFDYFYSTIFFMYTLEHICISESKFTFRSTEVNANTFYNIIAFRTISYFAR